MRYEDMNATEQKTFLQRLHRRLNRELFNCELRNIKISSHIILSSECLARYIHGNEKIGEEERMEFASNWIDPIMKGTPTQKEQMVFITTVLLHEMVHQYCALKGIDDSNHNENFKKAAKEHGIIIYIRKGGVLMERALDAIRGLRIY